MHRQINKKLLIVSLLPVLLACIFGAKLIVQEFTLLKLPIGQVVAPPSQVGNDSTRPVGVIQAAKLFPMTASLDISIDNVKAIKILARRQDTVLTHVSIEFADGKSVRLFALEGKLQIGQQKESSFFATNGNHVRKVKITSYTPDLRGPRGLIEVRFDKSTATALLDSK